MRRLILVLAIGGGCSGGIPAQPTVWTQGEGFRYRDLAVVGGESGFTPLHETGIDFQNRLSDQAIVENRHRMNGSGVAVGDADGDGLPDVFFAAMESVPRMFRNLGNWQFEDVTQASGLSGSVPRFSTGAVFADVDGDADLDLFVTALQGPNVLFENRDGTFVRKEAGLGSVRGSMTSAFADTDGDGDLDLYVTNYKRLAARDSLPPDALLFDRIVGADGEVIPELREHFRVRRMGDRQIRLELAEEDQYYLNNGDGTFAPAPIPGIDRDWGMTARLQDISGDGVPDLYVANDFESPDYLLLGDGQGGWLEGANGLAHTSNSSMAIDISDVNGDGTPDLFVPDMLSPDARRSRYEVGTAAPFLFEPGDLSSRPQYMQNTLHLGRGDGTFAEAAWAFGVAATEWSWSSIFHDVDLDGWDDLLVTTGHSFDVQDADAQVREREAIRRVRSVDAFRRLILEYPRLDLANVALKNHAGERFSFVEGAWGLGVEEDISHGMALGDLDGDGDMDVVTNRLNMPAGVFRNDASAARVAVKLEGRPPNTHGIGTRVELRTDDRSLAREVIAGGQYLSGSEAMAVFAAAADTMVLEVTWRSGRRQQIPGVAANRLYVITEPEGEVIELPTGPQPERTSSLPSVERVELARHQPSLASGVDGPPVAIGDISGDAIPDVVIGASAANGPVVYLGGPVALRATPAQPASEADWSDVAILDGRVVAVLADPTASIMEFRFEEGRLDPRGSIQLGAGTPGAVAGADVDADGDTDLFVGMLPRADRHPISVPSLLLRREGRGWGDPQPIAAGLATGAVFGDVDGDGDEDLAVSSQWGPVRLFENDGSGRLTEVTARWSLDSVTGLWRGVAMGDLDEDGDLDLVATNWGWNSRFGRVGAPDYRGRGVRLYFGDFDRNGVSDLIEAEYREDLRGWAPITGFRELRSAIPGVGRRVSSFHAFAGSTVEDLVGENGESLTASTLAHTAFLNVGNRFEARPLPAATQLSAATGVAVGNLVGNDHNDIAMAQNFFPASGTRQDAGRGLVLEAAGADWLVHDLGIYGDQRSIAIGQDYLVLTLHGGPAHQVVFK